MFRKITLLFIFILPIFLNARRGNDSFELFLEKMPAKIEIHEGIDSQFTNERVNSFLMEIRSNKNNRKVAKKIKLKADEYKLTNWSLLQYLDKYLNSKYSFLKKNEKLVLKFFFLDQWGFMPIIHSSSNSVILSVGSWENFYDFQFFPYPPVKAYVIDSIGTIKDSLSQMEVPINKTGNSFSFCIKKYPRGFGKTCAIRTLKYPEKIAETDSDIDIQVDVDYLKYVKNHPFKNLELFPHTPCSPLFFNSINTQLKKRFSKCNSTQKIALLLAFCEENIIYSADSANFGKDNWQIPEQTIFSGQGDCEDIAFLFAYLQKLVVGKKSILILTNNHLYVGIQLRNPIGSVLQYEGKQYSIADPTTGNFPPFNSAEAIKDSIIREIIKF